jgi:hypothetical protein
MAKINQPVAYFHIPLVGNSRFSSSTVFFLGGITAMQFIQR